MIRSLLSVLCLCFLLTPAHAKLEGRKPNIIFLLTDDQGYADISAHGNPILKTPNFDKLRSEGVSFNNWHNSPTCSPTRSALLTGRHEFRNGITHTILERERLDPKATTAAQVLKGAGYRTGIFGKWHLGDEVDYRPNKRGFDEMFIHGAGGIGQSYPGSCGDAPGNQYFNPAILHNDKFVKTQGYCTDVFFNQATQWMEQAKGKGAPFLCWIATNAPHSPYIARPEDRALYEGKNLGTDTENFYGMIHNIDQNLGKVMAKLDAWGIAKDTLIVAMNDNGGTAGVKVFNANMRGSKGSPWIGGTRAFSFWRWPGTLTPGVRPQLTAHLDFFRTAAELAGANLPDALLDQSAEGRSLIPLLADGDAKWPDRFLFSHTGRWAKGSDPDAAKARNAAVRNSQYTLVSEGDGKAGWQLFDVMADPSQEKNIAAQQPAIVRVLSEEYDAWWTSLKGQYDINEKALGPKLNPFAEEYWKQFGGGPTPEDLARMDPNKALKFESGRAGKGKGQPKAKAK